MIQNEWLIIETENHQAFACSCLFFVFSVAFGLWHPIFGPKPLAATCGKSQVGPSFKCHATGTVAALPTALGPLFKADMLRRIS